MNQLLLLTCVFLIYSAHGHAKILCLDLFSNAKKNKLVQDLDESYYIDQFSERLSEISTDLVVRNQSLYIRQKQNEFIRVADVKVIRPKYLFEYQNDVFHEYWMNYGGVPKQDIDASLKAKGQNYGRGFYVSLSATDSESYGEYLTVFKVDRPLVVLSNLVSPRGVKKNISENEKILNTLRSAGLSGIHASVSWYTIISENVLTKPQKLNEESLEYAIELGLSSKMQQDLLMSKAYQYFPANRFMNLQPLRLKKNVDQNIFDLKKILKKDFKKINNREFLILCLQIINEPISLVRQLRQNYPESVLGIMKDLLIKIKSYDENKLRLTLVALESWWSHFGFDISFKDFLNTLEQN